MIGVSRAKHLLAAFGGKKILVVGDLMLDRYVVGTVNRISPEAPVPVVRVSRERDIPGGAANVALNIRALGGQAVVCGIVGGDHDADRLLALLESDGISTAGVLRDRRVRTTVKTRILADRQQVVRVDREDPADVLTGLAGDFRGCVARGLDGVDGVIVEDYGKGVVTQEAVDEVLSHCAGRGLPVGLDPKDNHDLRISGIRVATPNYHEACGALDVREIDLDGVADPSDHLRSVAEGLASKWRAQIVIVTLGSHGMFLLDQDRRSHMIPTKAREVFDVSGAGDTVIAAAMLALLCDADPCEAALLANLAAGVVVGKIGTATCSPAELMRGVGGEGE